MLHFLKNCRNLHSHQQHVSLQACFLSSLWLQPRIWVATGLCTFRELYWVVFHCWSLSVFHIGHLVLWNYLISPIFCFYLSKPLFHFLKPFSCCVWFSCVWLLDLSSSFLCSLLSCPLNSCHIFGLFCCVVPNRTYISVMLFRFD